MAFGCVAIRAAISLRLAPQLPWHPDSGQHHEPGQRVKGRTCSIAERRSGALDALSGLRTTGCWVSGDSVGHARLFLLGPGEDGAPVPPRRWALAPAELAPRQREDIPHGPNWASGGSRSASNHSGYLWQHAAPSMGLVFVYDGATMDVIRNGRGEMRWLC